MSTTARKLVSSELLSQDVLLINGVEYFIERLVLPATRCCRSCVRLHNGEVFTPTHKVIDVVVLDNGRTECDCEDFIYRASQQGRECKHIIACRDVGLLADETLPSEEFFEQDADAEWQFQMELEHLHYADDDLFGGIE